MTSESARRILALYRPTIDAGKPQFADALAQAERDPELAQVAAGAVYDLRSLPQQIERGACPGGPPGKDPSIPALSCLVEAHLASARCLPSGAWGPLILLAQPRTQGSHLENYRRTMASVVTKYRMSLETDDPDRVRTFLANNQSPADYVLPASITRQRLLGCATLSWDGNPVSLLCFRHQSGTDLWLFVTHRSEMKGGPRSTNPAFAQANQVNTASWLQEGNLYLLATRGGPNLLQESLR
jgi:hypothetical protein